MVKEKTSKRNEYLDLCKAVAIVLVIIGHCIQCGQGENYLNEGLFYANPIFITIYSFHMPLFMMISGYLFSRTVKHKKFINIIKNKINQLIVPLICCSVISTLINTYFHILNKKETTLSWFLKKLISNFIEGPWFLWALWWCSIVVLVVHTFLKNLPFAFIIGLLLTFIIPDSCNLELYKYMYPYFVLSYYYGYYEIDNKYNIYINSIYTKITICVLFITSIRLFNYDAFIYTSGYTLIGKDYLKQFINDTYRFYIGLVGSIFVLYVIQYLSKTIHGSVKKILLYIGTNSMGVYLVSNYIFTYILPRITYSFVSINYVVVFIESSIVLMISLFINCIIKNNSILNRLLLGGR